jgi:hypothetical protein
LKKRTKKRLSVRISPGSAGEGLMGLCARSAPVGCASSHPKALKGGCFFASFFTKKEALACCHA